ncbi:MAG: DUF4252 domain-containing protein [bacterium]
MLSSIKKSVMLFLLVIAYTSCNQGESLQSYYVTNQEKPNFLTVDIPVSMVKVDKSILTEDQLEAYNSIDKLNMLGYSIKEDEEAYKTELAKVNTILKNPKYEELIRGGNAKDGRFVVKMIGDDELIDELIVLGSANERGFAVVRVLGDDMDPVKIMKLGEVINELQADESAVKNFIDFFQ